MERRDVGSDQTAEMGEVELLKISHTEAKHPAVHTVRG